MSEQPLPFEPEPAAGAVPAGMLNMSMVMVEITGVRRCAYSSCQTSADDDEIADEWVRTVLAAAQLRGPYLRQAVLTAMREQ